VGEASAVLLTIGWYVALSLIIPSGIGYWLDRPEMWNKQPLFTLIGRCRNGGAFYRFISHAPTL
jgi:hypothetical protein